MTAVKIVVASAGRRLYILQWLREAARRLDLRLELLATDGDANAAALTGSDRAEILPPYVSDEYRPAMLDLVDRERPDLMLSLNDYELMVLADGLADEIEAIAGRVLGVHGKAGRTVVDKFEMSTEFFKAGLPTPHTWLGSDVLEGRLEAHGVGRFVVKHRFGSGSSGVFRTHRDQLREAVHRAMPGAPAGRPVDGSGRPPADADLVVVQELIEGPEYGVDGVYDIEERGRFHGALARRKLSMRYGETDKAETVSGEMFDEILVKVGSILQPRGLIDTDIIVDQERGPFIIDVNPRFGGGYPFNHLAGADALGYYLAVSSDRATGPLPFISYRTGVVSAKHEGVVTVR